MAGVATPCEECEGKRFQAAVLEYKLNGRDIAEVLTLPVDEALEFFSATSRRRRRSWRAWPTSASAT